MSRGWLVWAVGAAVATGGLAATTPDEGTGAAAALRVLQAAADRTVQVSTNDTRSDPRKILQADLLAFSTNSGSLAPAAAARGWLALVDRYWALSGGDEVVANGNGGLPPAAMASSPEESVALKAVLAAIPGPAAWRDVQDQTLARTVTDSNGQREQYLQAFVLLLNGNWARAATLLDEMMRRNADEAENGGCDYWRGELARLRNRLRELQTPALTPAARFERQLAATRVRGDNRLVVPDLVSVCGSNEAARLIAKAVALTNVQLQVSAGDETRQLVVQAVLRRLNKLTVPPWGLVEGEQAIPLYEALIKRFPQPVKDADEVAEINAPFNDRMGYNNYEERGAAANYADALLQAGRESDALKLALQRPELLNQLSGRHAVRLAPPAALFRLACAVMQAKPAANLWPLVVSSGLEAGLDAEVAAALQQARPPLADAVRETERNAQLAAGWLALDRVDEGVAGLNRVLAPPPAGLNRDAVRRLREAQRNAACQLVRLGRLLERPVLIDQGAEALRKLASGSDSLYEINEAVQDLSEAGRIAQAEELVLARFKASAPGREPSGDDEYAAALGMLARTYHEAGRYADVLALLEQAPWWNVGDLQDLSAGGCADEHSMQDLAAAALLATGRAQEAARVARATLFDRPEDDAAYEVLVRVEGTNALPWLAQLYARDRFEERPLIWKAVALLQAKQVEAAEAAVREAIRVDPTDGETRAGDRVRSYAVLADVLEARGKADDAKLFRNVVASVRLAEKGDRLLEAGLLKRSLAMYDQASALFADAYCIQWRLAERLYATGHPEEAEKHYALVFERMPEQFGRVASLCFGCQGVFGHARSRSVAERILTRLSTNAVVRPQVWYLLGELRQAQERGPEAYACYRRAAVIDPDYLDAWKKMSETADVALVPDWERDALTLRMLRLDPFRRHARGQWQATDLRGVWETLSGARRLALARPMGMLPLKASQEAIARKQKLSPPGEWARMHESRSWNGDENGHLLSPGEGVVSLTVINELVSLGQSMGEGI